MPFTGKARTFIVCVTLIGWGVFAYGLSRWTSKDAFFFCSFLYLGMLATGLRVRHSFRAEAMPVQFLFVVVALKELSFSEMLLLAAAVSMLEHFSKPKTRLLSPDALFHAAVMTLAAGSAWLVYSTSPAIRSTLAAPLVLMLAASVYFAVSTLLAAQAIALRDKASVRRLWQDLHLQSYPYYVVGAAMASIFQISERGFDWMAYLFALPVLYLLQRSYRLYIDRIQSEKARAEQTASLHLQTVEALATAVEAKDQLTHSHLLRVQIYSMELGKELKLNPAEMESLRAASILHDIGKIGVPERILCKPGRLTADEFERVKRHTMVGAEIIERVDFPYPVAPIVRAHHERWDGSGYPDGLCGEQIPMPARVLTVADFLDAVSTDRQYRPASTMDEAFALVVADSGIAFDPRVVEALTRRLPDMVRIARERTAGIAVRKEYRPAATHGAPARGFQPAEAPLSCGPSSAMLEQAIHATIEMSEGLGHALSFNESLSMLAASLRDAVPFDAMALYLKDGEKLVPRYVAGENSRLLSHLEISRGEGPSSWVADHATPILNANPSLDPGYPRETKDCSPLRSMLTVPLESLSGLLGVLSLYREESDAFTAEQLGILGEVGPSVALAVQNALKLHEAEAAATTDYSTGLPNARSLVRRVSEELSRAGRESSPLTVMVCEMDARGGGNNATSYASRSEALRRVSEILQAACRPYDYLARWTMSGFAIVLPGLDPEAARERVAELIRTTNETARVCYQDNRAIVTVATASYPGDGADAVALLTLAGQRGRDAALAQETALGRCPSAFAEASG